MISLKKTPPKPAEKHTHNPLSEQLGKRQPVQTLFLCQPS